ncbi:uncharacterized protein LOC131682415 [Topomyia yanbarensis]|uniref:uncharacterized protein LOC131682415 n=1 Tax=Topomyia yanbarensis TaxID=2498891 RepID=UPI00273A886D|nr:uncharacterized protein LOC131682415 [Topomyia yanbarensis]
MAAVVEEPDLFNGLEITEMDDMNMENGDEYVFIPSDNENDEDVGGADHDSLASQSVFQRASASGSLIQLTTIENIDKTVVNQIEVDGSQVLPRIDLASLLEKTFGDGANSDTDEHIVANVDLTQENETAKDAVDQRYVVSYDLSLDTQELLSIGQTEISAAILPIEADSQIILHGVANIKDEIEIEESVVNFPEDEEAGPQMDLIVQDEHNLGSEVITLDSDADESEVEEDSILLSLLKQCPIKEEGPNEDKTPVENDHAYTTQQDEQPTTSTNNEKPEADIQIFMNLSKRLLEEADSSTIDIDQTLKSITSIEEQFRSLKEKILSQRERDALPQKEDELPWGSSRPGTPSVPCESPDPETPPTLPIDTTLVQHRTNETNNLSLALSENCSEPLECRSMPDLGLSSVSETSEQIDEAPSEPGAAPDDPMENTTTENLSKILSSDRSEPLENNSICAAMECDESVRDASDAQCNDETSADKDELPVAPSEDVHDRNDEEPMPEIIGSSVDPVNEATVPDATIDDKLLDSGEDTTVNKLQIASVEDLIRYGEQLTEQCHVWLDKVTEERNQKNSSIDDECPADDEYVRFEQFMINLSRNMQRLSAKVCPAADEVPVVQRQDVAVQTEKRKLTAEKAKSLNEKYKQRLLSSLASVEAVYSDSSDGADSCASNKTASSDSGSTRYDNDSGDDEAFERRQNLRKTKRLERNKALESLAGFTEETASQEDKGEASDSDILPHRKRNINRLNSTESAEAHGKKEVDEEEDDLSDPDLSQFLVPKSPVSSMVESVQDDIPVKNEPYSENDSEPISQKRIIRTDSVDYGNDEMEDPEMMESAIEGSPSRCVKLESSLNISPSQSLHSLDRQKAFEEKDDLPKDMEDQSDSELLEDVLPQVDDILLDVDDILPAAECVVQDYLVEEEVRSEQEEVEQKEEQKESVEKPKKAVKENESEDQPAAEQEEEEEEKERVPEDMTESELEEYYDNLREKEIDKLCNLDNLEVARNVYPQKPQEVKKKPVIVKKKDDRVMDDILNDVEIHHESDDSESDTEVMETEELFLQKCNENMKHQMLNQLSSSDTEQNSGSEDSVVEALRQDRGCDSDDSAGSILMEKFLKSLNKDHPDSEEEEEEDKEPKDSDREDGDKTEDMDQTGPDAKSEASITKENDHSFIDDESEPDNEEAMEKMKNRLKKTDPEASGDRPSTVLVTNKKTEDSKTASAKTTVVDPIDKQLFSKKMFREVDETLRKDRELEALGKENGSFTDRSERIASEDSDVELLDVSMFQPKRKLKEKPLECFDFSVTAKRATPQLKRKDAKEDDCISLSSESEAEVEESTNEVDEKENKQRKTRTMLTQDQLADETKTAQKDEEIRVSRLKKKNENLKKFLASFTPGPDESNLVLDYDSKTGKGICVHPDIVKLLKPHQREGVRFMYDNTYGSIDYINKHPGSGCILAHCMGLGKTLQLITLLHTVMRYPQLKTKRVLVICPKSTVMNWSDEIQHWLGSLKSGPRLKVFYFPDNSDVNDKLKVLSDWFSSTASRCGCMLIGYEAFRVLVNYEKRKRTPSNILAAKAAFVKKKVDEYLLDPGADLVICDEGHQIKNKKSAISGAVSQIKTRRRIVLTGTPIQNNLKEYYCMVNFIKPSFLGSDREFNNLYANPIKNGQHKDSDSRAIKIMKQRSYVLHNKLSKFVQRREAGVLKEFLPEKFEYVLFVPLTPVQEKMYEVFLQMNEYTTPAGEGIGESARGKKFKLLADYTSLRKIWTHPKVLEKAWETAVQEKTKRDARFRLTSTPDSDDDRPDDYNDISSGALSVTNDWWRRHLEANDLESMYPSNKLRVMFEILKQCQERGEKCLIFSAFVAVLNVVEHFMAKIHTQQKDPAADVYGYSAFKGPWEPGIDYYRLDGKTQKTIRHKMITSFNDPSNKRTKCFLISAKAGGQGINLIGANRVIILDTSWNPSSDQQNIFRIFRLGQKRKCFVYRLLAMGTMEEKVYSRSVTKQAMSFRVVDEQQIDRHYSFSELAELYSLSKVADQVRETPILPADDLLASLLRNHPACCFKYHEHDSLLENKPEQDLSEEDKKEAWAAYEREIQNNDKPSYLGNLGMMPNFMGPGFPGAPGSGIGPYPPINYPGLSGTLADMYRNDFGYGSSMNRLMYPYGSQPFPLINDPSYSSIMGKQPFPNYNLPGSSGGLPDFSYSAAMNGQGAPGTTSYNSSVALQSLLDLYAKSMSSGMSPSTVTTTTANAVSASTSASSIGVSPYNALSSLKQFNGFPPSAPSGSPIPHSSPQLPPPVNSQAPSSSSNAALINMLNEQPMPMSSAASSGPFSHLNSPLPAPSISIPPRSTPNPTVTTMATPSPVLTSTTVGKHVTPNTPVQYSVAPQSLVRPSVPPPPVSKPGEANSSSNNPKPVSLTTTVVASDDDDVDDDGIPRPHIIVRDPSSINAGTTNPQDKEKVVKKINMGIVYPEEKKKNQSKDIMLGAKSITNLAKPTIAVKNVESMKAAPSVSASTGSSKIASPVHLMQRPGSSTSKPNRTSALHSPLSNLPRQPPPGVLQPLTRGPLPSVPSQTNISRQQTPTPRQQVPVITSAKSLQLSSINAQAAPQATFSSQQRVSNLPPTSSSSTVSPSTSSTGLSAPRGSIAAQQLRELQQRMNLSGTTSSISGGTSHLVVAKPKKSQLISNHQRAAAASNKQSNIHPVGLYSSPAAALLANQKQQKAAAAAGSPATAARSGPKMTKQISPLSDSVSITKITSTGQRIAMNNPSISSISNSNPSPSTSTSSMSPALLSSSLGRKQDLVITKTIPGAATVRKVVAGPNMIVKQNLTSNVKRVMPTVSPAMRSTPAGTVANASGVRSLPLGTNSSITVRKRKAEPTLIDSLKAKNNSITISEVRSIYQPPPPKKLNQGPPIQPQKRLGSGITITPRKPAAQQPQQNVLEVVEIE